LALRRELYASDPEAHCFDLARLLGSYGMTLHGLGRLNEACTAGEEAVKLWRRLHSRNPDKFLKAMTVSLKSCSVLLHSVERFDEAFTLADEVARLEVAQDS